MKRDISLFLNDIAVCIDLIEQYVYNIDEEKFLKTKAIQDAVIRRLEIIGEATKHIPQDMRNKYPFIPWKDISGFRDVIIHGYFGMDINKIWIIINKDLSQLKENINKVIKSEIENNGLNDKK